MCAWLPSSLFTWRWYVVRVWSSHTQSHNVQTDAGISELSMNAMCANTNPQGPSARTLRKQEVKSQSHYVTMQTMYSVHTLFHAEIRTWRPYTHVHAVCIWHYLYSYSQAIHTCSYSASQIRLHDSSHKMSFVRSLTPKICIWCTAGP